MSTHFRPLTPEEALATSSRAAESFGREADEEALERWTRHIERGEMWALADGSGTVLAQGRLALVDHWFGGRLVPTQHVSSLAVPPQYRGAGAGRAFMQAAIERGAEQGAGLSLLFPATTRMYRSLGYEHAGTFTRYRVEARAAPALGPTLRRATDADWPAIRRCGDRAAAGLSGPPARTGHAWETLRTAAYHYVLDDLEQDGEVTAYALVNHRREEGSWRYTLVLDDWAALTGRGLQALVGFVGRHGTFGEAATFRDTVPDRWSPFVPELDVVRTGEILWMARGLDLRAAVTARGFPPTVSGETTLTVDDPLLPRWHGPWRLEVAGGRGRLEAAETAEVRLDRRAVGPLFTGFRSAEGLAQLGLVSGPPAALASLSSFFAGPVPVLFDFF